MALSKNQKRKSFNSSSKFLASNSRFQFTNSFTLIDVLIGIALVLIVFLGIFAAFRLGLKVVGLTKNKIVATALANQKMEEIRNLPYQLIGTEDGFPQGVLLSVSYFWRNNIQYKIETRIDYVVDPADGIAWPEDECSNDYKRAEVKVSWPGIFGGNLKLISDIAPKNLVQECAESGGILSVAVFDAFGQMISSPLIEIRDPQTDQVLKTATPLEGKHYFSLAPSTYKVLVSKTGYSQERTFAIGENYQGQTIASPKNSHPIVLEGRLTEISFSIDKISSFSIETLSPWGGDNFSDNFDNENKISEKNNLEISGGKVSLAKRSGIYFTGGTSDANLCFFPGIDGDCGQSFTMASFSKEISQLELYLRKATADPSDIYLEIREGGSLGNVLATSYTIDSASLPTSLSWITFTLQNPVTLSANTQYFLRLRSIPDSTDPLAGAQGTIHWGYIQSASTPPAYAGGDAWRYIGRNLNSSDSGQQLGPTDQYDFSFKIFDDEYSLSGYLISRAISPENLFQWDEFSWTDLEPTNTNLKYQIYYLSGTDWVLIPDSDLPGNSRGFDLSPIDLSGLNVNRYSSLKLRVNFLSSDSTLSPILYDWQVSWLTSQPTPVGNANFLLKGQKTVGRDENDLPVYKYSTTSTSDPNGRANILNLEWDNYTFSIDPATGLDLASTDPSPQPISLVPNSNLAVKLYLDAQNSLLLTVQNIETLEPIFSASARLYNSSLGYDQTQYTNEKGKTLFIPLKNANYILEVSAPGYISISTTILISGDTTKTIKLNQSE